MKDDQLFKLGQLVCTNQVNEKLGVFKASSYVTKHVTGDFGDLTENDKKFNREAIKNGDDRIFSAYETEAGRIYVITESDRSVTTVLFADEY